MSRLTTLRVRFALWTAGVLFIALILFGIFVYVSMVRSLSVGVDETLRLVVGQLNAEVDYEEGQPVLSENPVEAPQYAQLREQGFSLCIFNMNGELVKGYGPYQNLLQAKVDVAISLQPGALTTVIDPLSKDSVRVYTALISDESKVIGIIQVAHSLRNIQRTSNLLLITLLIGVPLVVILAGGGGYFLAGRALAPIDQITRTAHLISTKDLSARLNLPKTDDEVGRLVTTFDSMLARLDDGFQRERQFTADASHELRTPLTAMQAIIDGTLGQPRTTTEYQEALHDLNQEAQRMRTLTEGLLELARAEAEKESIKLESLNLSHLLTDIVESLTPLIEEKGLRLIADIPNLPLTVLGNNDGLIRLFSNLLDNALKYTEKGFIAITAQSTDQQRLAVTIADTGCGISPEHLPHIFDRFYRVEQSRSKQGIGLGLSIVRSIVRAHGGEIFVSSKPGTGTTFVVELPTP